MERPSQLHLGFQAIFEFQNRHKNLPSPHHEEHANEVVSIAKELNNRLANKLVEEIDEKLIKLLAYTSSGELPPIVRIFDIIHLNLLVCLHWWFCSTRSLEGLFWEIYSYQAMVLF